LTGPALGSEGAADGLELVQPARKAKDNARTMGKTLGRLRISSLHQVAAGGSSRPRVSALPTASADRHSRLDVPAKVWDRRGPIGAVITTTTEPSVDRVLCLDRADVVDRSRSRASRPIRAGSGKVGDLHPSTL
jgi:hypothetical protein